MMPGFASTFPTPDAVAIERYKKLKRMAHPDSGASLQEMATARAIVERMEAEFPSIRVLADPPKAPTPVVQPGSGVWDIINDVLGAAKSAVFARQMAFRSTEVTTRHLNDGRVRFTVVLDPSGIDQAVTRMTEAERAQFVSAVAEMFAAELQAMLATEIG